MTSNYEKYKNNGFTGLANLGNTCFINSCMQIFSHCYDFNILLEKIDISNMNQTIDSELLIEWIKLKELMWSKNCIISPNRFLNYTQTISKNKNIEIFTGFAQNDLPEFLIFVLDCFHNALKRKVEINISGEVKNSRDILAKKCFEEIKKFYNTNSYSEIYRLFYGIHVSLIQSKNNNDIYSIIPEPFSIINLPIPIDKNSATIYDCFDLYTEKELLENDNAWFNEHTNKKEDVFKFIKFWNFPDILIIDFKRFDNYGNKINKLVDFPISDLDLSKYVIGYNNNQYKYNLFGICNHSGGCLGGHYTSIIKHANDKWYIFNDTQIEEIKSNFISNKNYCLFYKKI